MEAVSAKDSGHNIYGRLREGHCGITAMNVQMTAYLSSATPPNWDVFDDFRWRYSRQSVQHLSFKDQYVYQSLLACGAPGVDTLIKELRREQEVLHGLVQKNILKWPQAAIRSNWSGYARDALPLAKKNAQLLDLEETKLHSAVQRWLTKNSLSDNHTKQRNWAGDIWQIRDAILKT